MTMQLRKDRPLMKALLRMLESGQPVTAKQLAEHTGISERGAKKYMLAAVAEGWAHISGWTRHGARGRFVPEVSKGRGTTAPYPTA